MVPSSRVRRIERCAIRIRLPTPSCWRFANRQQLGVGSRILIAHRSIRRTRDDGTIADDHSADRNFVSLHGFTREIERVTDVLLVYRPRVRRAECCDLLIAIYWQARARPLSG